MKKLACYTIAAVLASTFAISANAQYYRYGYGGCGMFGCGYNSLGYSPVVGTPLLGGDVAAVASDRATLMNDRFDRAVTRQHLADVNAKIRFDRRVLRSDANQLNYDLRTPYLTPVVAAPALVGAPLYTTPLYSNSNALNNWWD